MSKVIKKAAVKQTDEKQELLVDELIEVYKNIGYDVRVEKGSFKGGFCLLREQKLFLLNKNIETIKKINFLARNLSEIGIEDVFVKPELREIIERESGK